MDYYWANKGEKYCHSDHYSAKISGENQLNFLSTIAASITKLLNQKKTIIFSTF